MNIQSFGQILFYVLALNASASFVSNTNWQAYGGETTLSYLTQMLGLGVQNFLSAATGMAVLVALIRGIVRHTATTLGNFWVDLAHRSVVVRDQAVTLTPTEYDILRTLIQHAGFVLTHRQLLRAVWGAGYEEETHLLRVNISNLRAKIEAEPSRPQHILTEPGVGYRLKSL